MIEFDDPELDGTPLAHPAYYRGQDSGVNGACRKIQEVLEGKPIQGTLSHSELDNIRHIIQELMSRSARLDQLEKILHEQPVDL